jgi:beta-N-acetylhexosaminidase
MKFLHSVSLCLLIMSVFTVSVNTQTDPIQARIDQMTLQQKVGQMFMVHTYGQGVSLVARDMLQTWQPAGVVLFDNNISTPIGTTQVVNQYQQTMADVGAIPLFIATDQEGGWIMRMREGFTELPPIALVTATDDPDLTYRMGEAMAIEIRAVGVNMNLAPVADLDTNRANTVIGRRSPGAVPDLVGRMLTHYIAGMQAGGVLATVKHFPGHGDTVEDSHLTLPKITHSRDFLMNREIIPFKYAIDANVAAVMVAHIWFTAFDETETPATLSYNVVTGLLRQELDYNGIIMTDAMDMDAIHGRYTPDEAAIQAILAGVDLVVYGTGYSERLQMVAMQGVLDAVMTGRIAEARIDESVYRILSAKSQYGLFDWQPLNSNGANARIQSANTSELLPLVFDAGVTVAYDYYQQLPIGDTDTVALIYPGQRTLITRACGGYHPAIQWLSITNAPTSEEVQMAVELSRRVDKIVVFTRNAGYAQARLVNALPPEKTVAVALYSPYDADLFPRIGGYIITYGPQDDGVRSVCRILFGEIRARGTLAVLLNLSAR